MNSCSPFETSPFPPETPLLVADIAGDLVFYADFRDPADVTRTPFDVALGCAWTTDPSKATRFLSVEEAREALNARRFAQAKKLRIVAAPEPAVPKPLLFD